MASMEKVVSLCKRRGFVFPSSEIYGGLNGCWDYGPLGVELKRNVKEAWWQDMIASHDELVAPAGAPAQAGAGHASDVPFFFNTQAIKYEAGTTARDNAMGKIISAYLVNFARTGNPNGAGLPAWPRYDRAKDEIMDFAASGAAVPGKDPWGAELDAAAR